MKVTGVRLEFSKTVSDGRYGNESYNAQYIAELDEGEDPDEAIRELSQRGRREIIGQLAESESASIRYAIAPPKDVTPALREAEEAEPDEDPDDCRHDDLDDEGHCLDCGSVVPF